MIRLHTGSGSWEIKLLGHHFPESEWLKARDNVRRLLKARKRPGAILLEKFPWELRDGTNFFGDEFTVLYARLSIERYVEAAELEQDKAAREAATSIAKTFEELGTFVRFVAFEPDVDGSPDVVATPELTITAAVVSRALNDAERLLQTNGAVSAVDRVHTALHGYLRQLCIESNIELTGIEGVTGIWKQLRTKHPAFAGETARTNHVSRIVAGVATILDALNPVRNSASVAHPNNELLSESEAMLAVNAARTILHFLDSSRQHA